MRSSVDVETWTDISCSLERLKFYKGGLVARQAAAVTDPRWRLVIPDHETGLHHKIEAQHLPAACPLSGADFSWNQTKGSTRERRFPGSHLFPPRVRR
jgi:hypothetical protein